MVSGAERYQQLSTAIQAERLPAALVDLDAVDENVDTLLAPMAGGQLGLRLASKSIRSLDLIRYIQERAPTRMRGLMCFAAAEARYLFDQGFDDLLLAYPTVQAKDLEILVRLNRRGATVATVVDDRVQVDALAARARRADAEIPVVIDIDASFRPLGGALHLGVRRSPLHRAEDVLALAEWVRDTEGVRFRGLMAYEAQIAGLGDASPYRPALNPPKRWLRKMCKGPVARLRREVRAALEAAGFEVDLFNGGGTGSLAWAVQEEALTEVTAGSGFLDSHLFDYYRGLELKPAVFFALQITRRPAPQYVTCHGGGYVASGEAGPDRLPRPWLPEGLKLIGLEGAGEVQTPLRVPPGIRLELGAPVFFRHAKAGELAEHFNEYVLCRGPEVVGRAKTYRGDGQRFL